MADSQHLPPIMDPLLDYLEQLLASYPTAYNTVVTLLSYSYTIVASLVSLVASFFSSSSSSSRFNAETILPPIITLLTAYLALVSFYRTTSWMIRTAFAFVKWSFLLTALGATAGYFLANSNVEGQGLAGLARAGLGFLPALAGFVQEMLAGNTQTQNTRGGSGSRSTASSRQNANAKTQNANAHNRQPRPKAHESWDRHREWQYSENQYNQPNEGADVQKIIADIVGNVRENAPGWWEAAKGVVGDFTKPQERGEGSDGGEGDNRNGKARSR